MPDTEETKSTGLLHRLIAEKRRPVADVMWSGDPVRAAILKREGVSAAYHSPRASGLEEQFSDPNGYWTGFSARARVLIVNTELVPADQRPHSVMDLLDERFKNRACIANPLFGTTSMHAAAMFQVLGPKGAEVFFEGFVANGGRILSSNGEVRRRVAAGEYSVGITDTDDANVARLEGKAVAAIYPDADSIGTLIIPNCAVLIANGPNSDNARRFIDYLISPATERRLAESDAAQMPIRAGIEHPEHVVRLEELTLMEVNYDKLAPLLDELSAGYLKEWVDRNLE